MEETVGKYRVWCGIVLFLVLFFAPPGVGAEAIIIDHTCMDLSQIPGPWIDQVKTMELHYAHTSHGEQLTIGLEQIEASDSTYSVALDYCSLPTEAGALCIFDGQTSETYITPELYWDSLAGRIDTSSVLSSNPTITTSMWAWCTQQDGNTFEDTKRYLDAMAMLETANPGVTFIYMTGNAQAMGSDGYNRYLRNEQIRDHCRTYGKVLFDFADLDCWYNGDHATYAYGGHTIPYEHPHYSGDEAGHTTYESCEQKGRAVWWMMARLAGWDPGTSTTTTAGPGSTTTTTITDFSTTTTAIDGECLIEALYGEHTRKTELLRYLRDNMLCTTEEGREIISLYYELSPMMVRMVQGDEAFRQEVKILTDRILSLVGAEIE